MSTNGNGKSRIHLLDHQPPRHPAKDAKGRPLHRAPDLQTVYELIAEETAKVHEYYLNQIPQFVARMIQDALLSYGLIKLDPAAEEQLKAAAATPAEVAQPAEQLPRNEQVDGSSPSLSSDQPPESVA